MQYQVTVFFVCAFLVVNNQGAKQNLSSQHRCTVNSVCGVLENVLQRQDRLEKKVKEHSVALSGGRCNEGMMIQFVFNSELFRSAKRLVVHITSFMRLHGKMEDMEQIRKLIFKLCLSVRKEQNDHSSRIQG